MDQAAQDTRDILVGHVKAWRKILMRTVMQAMSHQQLREDIDPASLILEIQCLVLGAMFEYRVMGDANTAAKAIAAYRALIDRVRNSPARLDT
jgi:hypothetical protein